MSRVVLVTGVSRDLGARLARSLAADSQRTVIGLDHTPPRRDLGPVTFVRADLRSPVVATVLEQHAIDTVVHCAWVEADGVGTTAAKEANVLGTMQLVAACQQAPSVRKVILRSTGRIYGSSPLDPVRYREDTHPRRPPRSGPPRDAVDMELFVNGLATRRDDVIVTVLRLANLMGRDVQSALTRWLAMPVVPRPLGYNARLQFLHPADAVEALATVVEHDVPGTFNVAADDTVTLTQALRILGRPTVSLWSETPGLLALGRRAKFIHFSTDELRGITWGRVLETRAFADATGYRPHYTSRRALEEFAAFAPPGLITGERIDRTMGHLSRVLAPLSAAESSARAARLAGARTVPLRRGAHE